MSLICLSSRGLSDTPANFSNYFGGRGIQFGKNSEICLVGASIKKQAPSFDTDAPITIPASNNTFAIHYGIVDGADSFHITDDFVEATSFSNSVAIELGQNDNDMTAEVWA